MGNPTPDEALARPAAAGPVSAPSGASGALADPGALRNMLLQLTSFMAGSLLGGALTLYLVRALGASGYGIYALAISVGGLLAPPAGLGLPTSVGRFIADHWGNVSQLRAIFRLGLRLQLPVAATISIALFATAGPVARAYGHPALLWPLRWVALVVFGQTMLNLVMTVAASLRQSGVSLRVNVIESVIAASASAGMVAAGAGAAGAALGQALGFCIAAGVGVVLVLRFIRGRHHPAAGPGHVGVRTLASYAGAMFVVDITWGAITQVDLLLVGALLSSATVGSLGAVLRLLTIVGYFAIAVAAAVAPRLSHGGGQPDARLLGEGVRYLLMLQGLAIAPMLVWAIPLVRLLLGRHYPHASEVMRALSCFMFISGPGALIALSVTYLGEARRRVPIMLGTLAVGLGVTFGLVRAAGVVGAAVADDLIELAYVAAHVWICSRLIKLELGRLALSALRTLLAAAAMALGLLVFGTHGLSAPQWVGGALLGGALFVGALIATREVTISELRSLGQQLAARLRSPG